MSELSKFSLLWPENSRNFNADKAVLNDLSLDFLTGFMSEHDQETAVIERILSEIPADRNTIEYRQEIYRDLKKHPDICSELYEIFDDMKFYFMDDRRSTGRHSNIWDLLHRFSAMQNYVDSVTKLQNILGKAGFESKGMKKLSAYINTIYDESGFSELSKDLAVLADDAGGIYSMTLGVNLNADFYPEEVGIISLNRYPIGEKTVLERFMSFHRKNNPSDADLSGFSMITRPRRGSADESPLMKNLTGVVESMMSPLVSKLQKVLKKYTDISGASLAGCADEIMFYYRMVSLESKLNDAGLVTCIPEISDSDTVFHGLYSVKLGCLKSNKAIEENIVANDIHFSDEGRVHILTGPNRGGKTIITQALGLAFLMFQHGVFICSSSASLKICDGIYTHFPADENQTVELGRLGEEAERFSRICESASADSLILMNESFATTSHTESLYIAEDAVRFLCCLGSRTFFNTHMHELAENADRYRGETGITDAVSVVMGKRDSDDAFRIRYEKPDGKSFAREIAEKYGITFEQLSARLGSR